MRQNTIEQEQAVDEQLRSPHEGSEFTGSKFTGLTFKPKRQQDELLADMVDRSTRRRKEPDPAPPAKKGKKTRRGKRGRRKIQVTHY